MPIKKYETEEEYFARLKRRHASELRNQPYSVSELANGFFEVRDRRSGLIAVLNEDGTYRHGDLDGGLAESVYEEWVSKNSEQIKLGG